MSRDISRDSDRDFWDLSESDRSDICDRDKSIGSVYKLGNSLGSGTFGTTYMATKRGVPGNFVLKKLTIQDPKSFKKMGVSLADIHSEIDVLRRIAENNCRPDLLCYREHFVDCSNPESIKMIIVTDAFQNAMTLASFINRQVLDIPGNLDDQLGDLYKDRDEIEDKIERYETAVAENVTDKAVFAKHIQTLKEYLKRINVSISKKQDRIDNAEITPLPHKVLLTIMHNILIAMYYLHEMGIGHGDIKPENILINPKTYDIQIIDFGLACTVQCKPAGTIHYDAPEILQNIYSPKERTFSVKRIQRADVFSLGVVFFRLANGSYPFPKEILDDLEAKEERAALNSMIKYYKGSPGNIYSMYNDRRYDIDVKINDFIETFFEGENTRPSVINQLMIMENILDYYNQISNKKDQNIGSPVKFIPTLLQQSSPVSPSPIYPSPLSPSPISTRAPPGSPQVGGGFDKKRAKYPRKWSRAYCTKTSCDKMGFSQRSSCRYYKNCYK